MSKTSISASRNKIWWMALVSGVAVIAAVGVRMNWQQARKSAAPVQLAMDDSTAMLPLDPPPLPSDNAVLLRKEKAQVDVLSRSPTAEGRLQAAQSAREMGDLWRAESIARTISQQNPNYRLAQLTLASSLRQQVHFDEAARIYKQLLTRDSRDSDAYLGLADTMFAANLRPQAFEWLARGVADGAQTVLTLTTFAHRYQDWRDFPRAEQTADLAVKIAPDSVDALLQLASIQVESGKLDVGYQTLNSVFKKDPANELALRLMGVLLMNATYAHQDINRARGLFEQAVELNWNDPDIYRSVAVIYLQQHLYRLAAQAYDALLHLDPTSQDARYGLGHVYALLGKPEQSRKQLDIYKLLDERNRRITRLSEETVHQPLSFHAHAMLAQELEASGDFARALPQYQTAALLSPGNQTILNALDQFYARLGWPPPKQNRQ